MEWRYTQAGRLQKRREDHLSNLRELERISKRRPDELRRRVEAPRHLVEDMWNRLQTPILEHIRKISSIQADALAEGRNYDGIRAIRLERDRDAQLVQNMTIEQIRERNAELPVIDVNLHFDDLMLQRYCEGQTMSAFNRINEAQGQDLREQLRLRTNDLMAELKPGHLAEFLRVHEQNALRRERRERIERLVQRVAPDGPGMQWPMEFRRRK
jgi:hypothetical protein